MTETDRSNRGAASNTGIAGNRQSHIEEAAPVSARLPDEALSNATAGSAGVSDFEAYQATRMDFKIRLNEDGSVRIGNFFGEAVTLQPKGPLRAITEVDAEIRIKGWSGHHSNREGEIEVSVDGQQMLSVPWPKSYHACLDLGDTRTVFKDMPFDDVSGDRVAMVKMPVMAVLEPDQNDQTLGRLQIKPIVKIAPTQGPEFGFGYIKYRAGERTNG